MANIFAFSLSNPLRLLWQGDNLPSNSTANLSVYNPAYNSKPFDWDFAFKLLKSYEEQRYYLQPYQQSDIIRIQWLGDDATLANYQYARLLDSRGNVNAAKTVTVVQESGIYFGMKLYTVTMKLYDVPEGVYFLQLAYYGSGQRYYAIFEPVHIKQIHANTVRIDAYNTYNDQDIIFPSASYVIQLRVHGFVRLTAPDAEFNVYQDQPLNKEILSAIPIRLFELLVAPNTGIPDWMADKINRLSLFNSTTYDGFSYTREANAKLEPEGANEAVPMTPYRLKLGERYNSSSVNIYDDAVQMGAMPQTKYFWIERIRINGSYTNIRMGFKGKRNFLDYLNSTFNLSDGYWGEDSKYQLLFIKNPTYSLTGVWSLDAVDVLPYGIRFLLPTSGTLNIIFYKGAIGSTVYYAIQYGDGTASVNKTAYTGSPNPIKAYSSTVLKEHFIYFSDCEELDVSNVIVIESISGDFPPSFKDLRIPSSGSALKRMENNMFRFVNNNGMTMIWLQNQNLTTYPMDDIVRFLYDSIGKLNTSCQVYLDSQSPAGPPSKYDPGISFMLSKIKASVTTLTTD